MSKTETIAEYLARGGAIKKVHAGGSETKSYVNRTMGNTKKAEWNKLKAWKTQNMPEVKNG